MRPEYHAFSRCPGTPDFSQCPFFVRYHVFFCLSGYPRFFHMSRFFVEYHVFFPDVPAPPDVPHHIMPNHPQGLLSIFPHDYTTRNVRIYMTQNLQPIFRISVFFVECHDFTEVLGTPKFYNKSFF